MDNNLLYYLQIEYDNGIRIAALSKKTHYSEEYIRQVLKNSGMNMKGRGRPKHSRAA